MYFAIAFVVNCSLFECLVYLKFHCLHISWSFAEVTKIKIICKRRKKNSSLNFSSKQSLATTPTLGWIARKRIASNYEKMRMQMYSRRVFSKQNPRVPMYMRTRAASESSSRPRKRVWINRLTNPRFKVRERERDRHRGSDTDNNGTHRSTAQSFIHRGQIYTQPRLYSRGADSMLRVDRVFALDKEGA